ncbi:hypothetical protein [Petroclostridium sp. X23]|uniref:hypothetical protein n=1 Tax=Petroclostridium sp. X23 TaxID=3045146 RepID=UPI0024ACCB93|nr:hypothetical protein [Petroclostridium sp. X23]WHH58372.1 hypothetical protein QKW49_21625 [Petroclostridium sp. X23]
MIVWKCPNPKCNINNVFQQEHNLLAMNKKEVIQTYETQCSNCLKKYEIVINTRLNELKIRDKSK